MLLGGRLAATGVPKDGWTVEVMLETSTSGFFH